MALNLAALMSGAGAVANHPVTKGGALAALVTGGLYAAAAAGVVVPGWAFVAGPIFGTLLYKFLPAKDQAEIDDVAAKVTDTFNTIPTITPDYTHTGNDVLPSVVTNLKTKDGADVGSVN